ncbi:MAG: HypC/HybG/HupF family hydrogenase formation chaperone, partial [Candidatus Kariarchaeaceae archaeon]
GLLEDEVAINDWVLLHTGFAIAKIDEQRAKEILEAYELIE